MAEQTGVRANDSYGGREPTSHERRARQPWDASYLDGPAPWDIGQPQPVILRLAAEGAFAGAVLDAGCGTGENALHVASVGLHVLGVDVAETAVSIAREKAAARGIDADFVVADALHLDRLGRLFETVLDCGLFHTFDSDERREYVASLASVTSRGGNLYVLCFSDVGPDTGPHPISQEELRVAFKRSSGWGAASVRADPDKARRAGCARLVGEDRTDLVTGSGPSRRPLIAKVVGRRDHHPRLAGVGWRPPRGHRFHQPLPESTIAWATFESSASARPAHQRMIAFATDLTPG